MFLLAVFVAVHPAAFAQPKPAADTAVTSPKEFVGFNMGADYFLANYKPMVSCWQKLEGETDRMKVVSIGKTEEGGSNSWPSTPHLPT